MRTKLALLIIVATAGVYDQVPLGQEGLEVRTHKRRARAPPRIESSCRTTARGRWRLSRKPLESGDGFRLERPTIRRGRTARQLSRRHLLADKEPPAVRLGAARTVADIGLHQHDAETILKKLDKIEARQRR